MPERNELMVSVLIYMIIDSKITFLILGNACFIELFC